MGEYRLRLATVLGGLAAVWACGGSSGGGSGSGADGGADSCPAGEKICQEDTVHVCNEDGTVGSAVDQCEPGTCYEGECFAGGDNTNCETEGNDLIYVVDNSYNLLSFDPERLGSATDPFTLIGQLDCPAGSSWPNWSGGGSATPFSMSVDREGYAWVLYTSGEIFKVSIADASCSESGFQKGQEGFELFGMGYVSDSAGSNQETLFISGGSAAQDEIGDLGRIQKPNLDVATIGGLPLSEYGPELTGTGNGELYAYYPGFFETFVARMSKDNASVEQEWELSPLGGDARAWAFAHYGGKFYIFISTEDVGITSRVLEFDPTTGNDTVVIPDSDYMVVGAGVSTCAPVVVD